MSLKRSSSNLTWRALQATALEPGQYKRQKVQEEEQEDSEYDELASDQDELDDTSSTLPVDTTAETSMEAGPSMPPPAKRSRQYEARREIAASREGQEKKVLKRKEDVKKMKEEMTLLKQAFLTDAEAITKRAASLRNPAELQPLQRIAILLTSLNTVRTGQVARRYAVVPSSRQLERIISKPATVAALLSLFRLGKTFDPTAHPEVLEREEEVEEVVAEEDEEEGGPSVCFKFYLRCTPERSIEELLEQMEKLEEQYPNECAWTAAQLLDLKARAEAGATHARIFYGGTTIYSCIGREIEDGGSADGYSLLLHWKEVVGDQMEVYRWKELDIKAATRYAWRTDESISGIEEVLVDAAGGPALTLNQHPGGFVPRIKLHTELLEPRRQLALLRNAPTAFAHLSSSLQDGPILSKQQRCQRISNMLDALVRFVDRYPRAFKKPVARDGYLEGIKRIACRFELEGQNAPRAIMRKDLPEEALSVPNKLYDDLEVGRGSRQDRQLDEEGQGIVSFNIGTVTGTYTDRRYAMLDLWCVTIDHPDDWIIIQIIVLVVWVSILKPRYVAFGAAKLVGLAQQGYFGHAIFQRNDILLQAVLDGAFAQHTDEFDANVLARLLHDPQNAPNPNPVDDRQLLTVILILIWIRLTPLGYIQQVGRLCVVKIGVRFCVTIALYDGGGHFYVGNLRPLTVQLAQACQAMVDVLEIVTANLAVDGSESQAKAILAAAEAHARQIGLLDALERIRQNVIRVSLGWNSLKTLGSFERMSPEQLEQQRQLRSAQMSNTVETWNSTTLKAAGAQSSKERLAQVLEIVDGNRKAINERTLDDVLRCPDGIEDGPASLSAFKWFLSEVEVNSAYARAAHGGSRRDKTPQEEEFSFLDGQLNRLKDARKSSSSRDVSVISVPDALEYVKAKIKAVRLVTCKGCDFAELVKREKGFEDKFRHACQKLTGTLKDLDDLQKEIEEKKKKLTGNSSFDGKLKKMDLGARQQRWSANAQGGQWSACADDKDIQAIVKEVNAGTFKAIVNEKKTYKQDHIDKHGRLVFEDMTVASDRLASPDQLNTFLQGRLGEGLPMPASFGKPKSASKTKGKKPDTKGSYTPSSFRNSTSKCFHSSAG